MLPEEEMSSAQAIKKYKPYFDFSDELLNLAIEMTTASIKITETEHPFALVVLGLYAKSCKTFRSIQILCSKPLGEDANSLLRTLMETCISLYYVAEDKKERPRLFIEKMIKNSKSLGVRLESNKQLRRMQFVPEDRFEEVKKMCKEIDREKPKMPVIKKIKRVFVEKILRERIFLISSWSGKSLQNMAYEVGLRNVYDLTNPLSSATLHGEDLLDHINYSPGKGFSLKIVPGDKWVNPVLPSAILMFLMIIDKINSLFSLGKEQVIKDFSKKFEEFQKSGNQPV